MAETFDLEIATPERMMVSEPVSRAQVPAKNGYIGVLPDHASLLSELGIGVLTYVTNEYRYSVAISGGYVEVFENHVRVLADVAQLGEEIDAAQAENEKQQAQAVVASTSGAGDSLRALHWAQARVDAARETDVRPR